MPRVGNKHFPYTAAGKRAAAKAAGNATPRMASGAGRGRRAQAPGQLKKAMGLKSARSLAPGRVKAPASAAPRPRINQVVKSRTVPAPAPRITSPVPNRTSMPVSGSSRREGTKPVFRKP